ARLDDDVLELRALVQAAGGAHAELIRLPRGRGRIADAAGRDVDVLLAQRVDDVARGELPRGQARRVQPDAHRVLARAEGHDIRHARDALQRVLHVDVDVVGQEQRIVLALLRVRAGRQDEVGRGLRHRHTELTDFGRQPAGGLVDAVLDVDGRKVRVPRDVEGDGNRACAVV